MDEAQRKATIAFLEHSLPKIKKGNEAKRLLASNPTDREVMMQIAKHFFNGKIPPENVEAWHE